MGRRPSNLIRIAERFRQRAGPEYNFDGNGWHAIANRRSILPVGAGWDLHAGGS